MIDDLTHFIRTIHEPAMQKCVLRVKALETELDSLKTQLHAFRDGSEFLPAELVTAAEAERDQMIRIATTWRERCEYAEGREPAIEAETIEKCVAILRNADDSRELGFQIDDLEKQIRALAKPPSTE